MILTITPREVKSSHCSTKSTSKSQLERVETDRVSEKSRRNHQTLQHKRRITGHSSLQAPRYNLHSARLGPQGPDDFCRCGKVALLIDSKHGTENTVKHLPPQKGAEICAPKRTDRKSDEERTSSGLKTTYGLGRLQNRSHPDGLLEKQVAGMHLFRRIKNRNLI